MRFDKHQRSGISNDRRAVPRRRVVLRANRSHTLTVRKHPGKKLYAKRVLSFHASHALEELINADAKSLGVLISPCGGSAPRLIGILIRRVVVVRLSSIRPSVLQHTETQIRVHIYLSTKRPRHTLPCKPAYLLIQQLCPLRINILSRGYAIRVTSLQESAYMHVFY